MLKILDFSISHIRRARDIALENYNLERKSVKSLPEITETPDLTYYAENHLGVSAFDGDIMVGYLCGVSPFKNAFGSTDATGVFSPMEANGVINRGNIDRAKVYALLYQTAGEKWVNAGASSHAVCLYAHDKEAQTQFFKYGFGMRCIDAIRGIDNLSPSNRACEGYEFAELTKDELPQILPLDHMLDAHMASSPCFILRPSHTEASFLEDTASYNSIFYAAKKEGRAVAYIRAERDGETFICDTPGYLHIKGAYCLPAHRGQGLYKQLLEVLIQGLKERGYTRLGVDFESINPAAYGFWMKYFDDYTCSVVRRVDERAVLL